MKRIKSFFRRLATIVVVWQTNRIYREAVKIADQRHEQERTRIYVIEDPFDRRQLSTFNRKQFRAVKNLIRAGDPTYSVVLMKEGAYYYTPDAGENGIMAPHEKEARRLALIRLALRRARLV